jgi:hypothetical protein
MPASSPGPLFPNTCCLPGYTYNSGTHKCVSNLDPQVSVLAVPCACCPPGLTYINNMGTFLSPTLGMVAISNPAPSLFYNTCVRIVNGTWAQTLPMPARMEACPCCPEGYTWVSTISGCVDQVSRKRVVKPIPCIPCVCVDPPPPPPCVDCQGAQGNLPISFQFDPTTRACVDCYIVGAPVQLCGGAATFMPIQLQDPIINFTLNP